MAKGKDSSIYEIEIEISGIEPRIWREVAVSGNWTLRDLHHVIQATMGWEDCHLYQFVIRKTEYGPSSGPFELFEDDEGSDDGEIRLCDLLKSRNKFSYTYDFGDCWQHELRVRSVHPPKAKETYPLCRAGGGACPPEDCGGTWGYANILAALSAPKDEDNQDQLEWVGEDFDPKAFNLDKANARLKG